MFHDIKTTHIDTIISVPSILYEINTKVTRQRAKRPNEDFEFESKCF